MIFYPVLEGILKWLLGFPTYVWGIGVLLFIFLGMFGFKKERGAYFGLLGTLIMGYGICYLCTLVEDVPILGACGIILRLAVDVTIIAMIVLLLKNIFD